MTIDFRPQVVAAAGQFSAAPRVHVHLEFHASLTCSQKALLLEALISSAYSIADESGLVLFEAQS